MRHRGSCFAFTCPNDRRGCAWGVEEGCDAAQITSAPDCDVALSTLEALNLASPNQTLVTACETGNIELTD
jgi:hypothetical protein